MIFVRHTHSYPIWGTVCVSPSDSNEARTHLHFYLSPSFVFPFNRRGTEHASTCMYRLQLKSCKAWTSAQQRSRKEPVTTSVGVTPPRSYASVCVCVFVRAWVCACVCVCGKLVCKCQC